jgi:hypothetical protein
MESIQQSTPVPQGMSLPPKTRWIRSSQLRNNPPNSNDFMAELTLASAKVVATTDLNLNEEYAVDVLNG